MKRVKYWMHRLIKIINEPEMKILPGNLAFFLMMSIIPILLLIGYVTSLFGFTMGTISTWMSDVFPSEVSAILISFIEGRGVDSNIILFMIVGFFIASNGADSLIISSNILYKKEDSSYLKRRIKALVLTILLVFLVVIMLFILAFGDTIFKFILNIDIFKNNSIMYLIFSLFKWPIAFILIFFTIKVLYVAAPNGKVKASTVNKGALLSSLSFMLITAFYSYYVTNFTHYDLYYAGLSNIAILMIWLYLLSYILVLGIAVNANNYSMEKNTDNTLN